MKWHATVDGKQLQLWSGKIEEKNHLQFICGLFCPWNVFFYFLISDDKEITPSSLLQEWGHAKLGVCFFFLKVIQLLVDSLLSIPFIL